jgi:hypothetical protein
MKDQAIEHSGYPPSAEIKAAATENWSRPGG